MLRFIKQALPLVFALIIGLLLSSCDEPSDSTGPTDTTAPDGLASEELAALADHADLAMDFYTTLALSNRGAGGKALETNGCFQYLPAAEDPVTGRQRGADMFASFHGQQMGGPAFQAAASPDGQLRAGGVEYLLLEAPDGATEIGLIIDVPAEALPRLRIARIQ